MANLTMHQIEKRMDQKLRALAKLEKRVAREEKIMQKIIEAPNIKV